MASVGAAAGGEQAATRPAIERASVSFRIGSTQWLPDARFRELLDLFEKHKGVTDEITFFTGETCCPLPLDVAGKHADILARRMADARAKGYRAGINVLATLGHVSESLSTSLSGPYIPITGIAGDVCRGSLCPNDENARGYIKQLYTLLARANPDYIWIDDDVRIAWHPPVIAGCFCDKCLAIFEKECGKKYTRETLKAAFITGTDEQRVALRRAWIRHNTDTIARLLRLIETSVHEVKPGLPLGYMTGDRFYEGYAFDEWARILAGAGKAEVRWRPGGGFYRDERPDELAMKSHDLGRQVSILPADVVSIQSEIENFVYERLAKSANITALEAASHIASGCTGTAFNVLSMYDEPLTEYEPLMARLAGQRPFLDLMARRLGRAPVAGIFTLWTKDSAAVCDLAGGDWGAARAYLTPQNSNLFQIGLPSSYSMDHASVTVLCGDGIRALAKEQILGLLAKGVFMDAQALSFLNQAGYSELTGFAIAGDHWADCVEKFTSHPLNGGFAGRKRDGRQSFGAQPAFALKKTDEKAQIVAGLVDYADREVAPCTLGVFENRLGGRVCVAGYYPWTMMESLAKTAQVKAIMRWLARDTLPAYVASYHKINLWVRERGDGDVAIAFTNSSFDPAVDVTLMIPTDKSELTVFDMACRATRVPAGNSDGPYRAFVIPRVEPWEMRLITSQP